MAQPTTDLLTESRVTYEIWQEADGVKRRRHALGSFLTEKGASMMVDDYNVEEAENARLEMRPVRTRYFVVKATATLEEIR